MSLEALSFTGKKFQDVRTSLNRAEREGIRAQWYTVPERPVGDYRTDQGDRRGLGGGAEPARNGLHPRRAGGTGRPAGAPPGRRGRPGRVHGVVSWMPVYREGGIAGWTLDYMRRPDSGFRPAIEFLIASAALSLRRKATLPEPVRGAPGQGPGMVPGPTPARPTVVRPGALMSSWTGWARRLNPSTDSARCRPSRRNSSQATCPCSCFTRTQWHFRGSAMPWPEPTCPMSRSGRRRNCCARSATGNPRLRHQFRHRFRFSQPDAPARDSV